MLILQKWSVVRSLTMVGVAFGTVHYALAWHSAGVSSAVTGISMRFPLILCDLTHVVVVEG